MFTNVFILCDDVIRLPWQPLFIEHDFFNFYYGRLLSKSLKKPSINTVKGPKNLFDLYDFSNCRSSNYIISTVLHFVIRLSQ